MQWSYVKGLKTEIVDIQRDHERNAWVNKMLRDIDATKDFTAPVDFKEETFSCVLYFFLLKISR